MPLNKESPSTVNFVHGSNRFFSRDSSKNRNILRWQNVNHLNVELGDER